MSNDTDTPETAGEPGRPETVLTPEQHREQREQEWAEDAAAMAAYKEIEGQRAVIPANRASALHTLGELTPLRMAGTATPAQEQTLRDAITYLAHTAAPPRWNADTVAYRHGHQWKVDPWATS